MNVGFQEGFRKIRGFLIGRSYFYTLYLINRQITNLEVVPDTDKGYINDGTKSF